MNIALIARIATSAAIAASIAPLASAQGTPKLKVGLMLPATGTFASLGTAIAIKFQPLGEGKAAITGDFVLLGSEVAPVMKTLRQHDIEVTALHSHMIDDSPHLFFMHFWAHDDVQKLAQGLRAALDLTNVKRGS